MPCQQGKVDEKHAVTANIGTIRMKTINPLPMIIMLVIVVMMIVWML